MLRAVRAVRISAPDGSHLDVEATGYEVDDDGALVVLVGDEAVRRVPALAWVAVDLLGEPLAETWPPDDLDLLLDRLAWKLVVGWGETGQPGVADDYSSPLLNDEEALLAAVLDRFGRDASSSEHRRLVADLQTLVRQHFGTVRP
jgi:hypothetical protein